LREQGLRITSPHGDATLHPKFVTAGEVSGPYDAVLQTMILPVLNGMRHMGLLAQRFSLHNLVGCALKVATVIENDGRIVQLTPLQDFAYGELDGRTTARITSLDQFMQGAAIAARLSDAIRREMWEKWILLAGLGAITCLTRGTVGEIEACAGGAALTLQLLDEVVAIVNAVGEPPSDGFVKAARAQLTAKGSPLTSSMFRDLQRGRPIEVEDIVGDIVRRGTQAGLNAPLLEAAYINLHVYQNRIATAQ
jgi:2-dehydropantoate 2-reductase